MVMIKAIIKVVKLNSKAVNKNEQRRVVKHNIGLFKTKRNAF